MENINPTKSRNRRAGFYLWVLGAPVFMIGMISAASVIGLFIVPAFGPATVFVQVCLGLLLPFAIIGGAVGIYRGLTLPKDNEIAYQVGEVMRQSLASDPRYTYIRNVSRRNLGYIDAVLVGPPGALVFRVVDYAGTWRNERAEWRRVNPKNNKLQAAPDNPTREAARDVYALRKYLQKRNLDKVPVYGVVVFHNRDAVLQGDGSVVPITHTHRLFEILKRNYLAEERLKNPQIRATVDAIIDG